MYIFPDPCHGPGPGPMGPPWAGPLCGPPGPSAAPAPPAPRPPPMGPGPGPGIRLPNAFGGRVHPSGECILAECILAECILAECNQWGECNRQ